MEINFWTDGTSTEANPFMGFRAIRYCLSNPNVFLVQLRAILRASAHGNVRIMLPMISGIGEVIRAKELLTEAKEELKARGDDFDSQIKVGCMIETPAAVAICDLLAEEADFLALVQTTWFNICWRWTG